MKYSGAGGKLIHEKNQKKKSRDTVPLIKQKKRQCLRSFKNICMENLPQIIYSYPIPILCSNVLSHQNFEIAHFIKNESKHIQANKYTLKLPQISVITWCVCRTQIGFWCCFKFNFYPSRDELRDSLNGTHKSLKWLHI